MPRIRVARRKSPSSRTRAPFDSAPSLRLARAMPSALLQLSPHRAAVPRVGADGLERLVLVRRVPPREQAWRVVQRDLVIAVGASAAEAVDRALFLWGHSGAGPAQQMHFELTSDPLATSSSPT